MDPGWRLVAPAAGYLCAASLVVATLLYLADVTDLLAERPAFTYTEATYEADLAAWFVDHFERQDQFLWSIAARDTLFPVAFVCFMVLGLATSSLVGWRRPAAQLSALFLVLGGVLHVVNDLLFLGQADYWRHEEWQADPPGPMVATGQASTAIGTAPMYVEVGSYVLLAAGLVCLGVLCRTAPYLPAWLGLAAHVEAVGMLVLVVGRLSGSDTLFQLGGLATGILLGPVVAAALGRQLGRRAVHTAS
jgi:hypothetical protein